MELMQVIGLSGKSGSGKTEAAGIVTAVLGRMGYTVKLDGFAEPIRKEAIRNFGQLNEDDPEQREWMQRRATEERRKNPHCFVNALFRRNSMKVMSWGKGLKNLLPADFLVIHDVRMENEVAFCRRYGVVVHIQGTHKPLSLPAANHETEFLASQDLFHGADYIIPKQPSLARLADAVKAMIEVGKHLKPEPEGAGVPTIEKGYKIRATISGY